MLDARTWSPAHLPDDATPRLMVIVDTEEEFDWSAPFDRAATGVAHIRHQQRAHDVFDRYGLKPTYLMDYPVVCQPDGYGPLLELFQDGRCAIGTHLHPWVSPPFDEPVSRSNSYPGNLPAALEEEKLRVLTHAIADRFGVRPTVYRAGRYGAGPNTADILDRLGYEIDTSVVPRSDFRDDHGPDFRHCDARPYWFGSGRDGGRRLLELPLTVGFVGLAAGIGHHLHGALTSSWGTRARLQGITARLGLLDRLRLSPEGIGSDDHIRLTRAFLRAGHKVFALTYHSPSLDVGHTPYVRCETDLTLFIDRLKRYCDFFFGEIGGAPATPDDILTLVNRGQQTVSDR